ncbi:hypothetical protein ABBQ32_013476 [Trebouxia sp. C0010 RCD-2024]
MRAELLKQAQIAKAEAFHKAETAVKLVARAQRLARMAEAGASGRLNWQDGTSASSLQHDSAEQQHHSLSVPVPPSCAPPATCARRVHSKTRAGAAAVAALQAPPPQPQVQPTRHAPSQQQQQQQQQPRQRRRQQQRCVSAMPKRSSSESSTAFSAHRHAHAGTKRSQEAASLPSTDSHQTQFKSHCAEPTLLNNPTELGSRRRTAVTWQAAEAATAAASEVVAHQQQNLCQFPAVDSLPLCEAYTVEAECLLDSVCQLVMADSQHTCGPDLLAPTHRHSSTGIACNWAAAGASHLNSAASGGTSLLAGVKSEPQPAEEMDLRQTSLPVHSQFPVQQVERQQHAHPMTSESASVSQQQHQLHMIDLMLARVSAAEDAIQLGLSQSGPYLNHCDCWAPAESCKMLLDEVKVEAPEGDAGFSSIDSFLLCAQQPQCSLEEMPDIHDKAVHVDRSDYTLKGYTERTHSSSGSSIDCPGRLLVPQDWLIDGNDEVDLAYFSKLPNDDSVLGLPLPLLPPSLRL